MPSELEEVYWKIEEYAKYLMKMYKKVESEERDIVSFTSKGVFKASRFTYRDALIYMKECGLIRDYRLDTGEIFL